MNVRKIVIISPSAVWIEGHPELITLEALMVQERTDDVLLVAVVPDAVARVAGTSRTLDSALTHQFPMDNAFATVPLQEPFHQAFALANSVIEPLKKLGRIVRVIPYPIVLASMIQGPRQHASFAERTLVLLRAAPGPSEPTETRHSVVVEAVGAEYLMVACIGQEIVSVRHARGSLINELNRTIAASRLENPVVFCTDEDAVGDLQVQGIDAEFLLPSGPVAGAALLSKFAHVEFKTLGEMAQKRLAESRKSAWALLGVAASVTLLTAGAWGFLSMKKIEALATSRAREEEKQTLNDSLASLYSAHYGSVARENSLQIQGELFDLSTVLPPQVEMLSVTKDGTGTVALLERRAQSAPFDSQDLRAALRGSTYFSDAEISETYDGHIIRYSVKVPVASNR